MSGDIYISEQNVFICRSSVFFLIADNWLEHLPSIDNNKNLQECFMDYKNHGLLILDFSKTDEANFNLLIKSLKRYIETIRVNYKPSSQKLSTSKYYLNELHELLDCLLIDKRNINTE